MALQVRATPTFNKAVKKLHEKHKAAVDAAIRHIIENPSVGDAKKGDLAGVSVYKFKINRQEVLLSYSVNSDELRLLTLGSHENFYRDLKTL